MKTALILHGKPSKDEYFDPNSMSPSNEHWLPWLQHELQIHNIPTQTPEMPTPYAPVYEEWKKLFECFEINKETTLIGHSCGGGFLVRWLSETNVEVAKLVLVAPWLDPENTLSDKTFFTFEIDENLHHKASKIHILYSTDDSQDVLTSVNMLMGKTKHEEHVFSNYGHFCYEDINSRKFPELLEICLEEY